VSVRSTDTSVPRTTAEPADAESQRWLQELLSEGAAKDAAVARLHVLLAGAARFEVSRRRPALADVDDDELDEIALKATTAALSRVIGRLEHYRGHTRFTTWAYKFAVAETASRLRERSWQQRELLLEHESWAAFSSAILSRSDSAEQRATLMSLQAAMQQALTPRERRVLTLIAISDVPIDVVAGRLGTTRASLYQTLKQARDKLQIHIDGSARGADAR
jgi:RNA polymerase sigma-70 factor (ECF subfamily)